MLKWQLQVNIINFKVIGYGYMSYSDYFDKKHQKLDSKRFDELNGAYTLYYKRNKNPRNLSLIKFDRKIF